MQPRRDQHSWRMVRILANGEIVQDDDPRVRTTAPPRNSAPRQVGALPRGWGAIYPLSSGPYSLAYWSFTSDLKFSLQRAELMGRGGSQNLVKTPSRCIAQPLASLVLPSLWQPSQTSNPRALPSLSCLANSTGASILLKGLLDEREAGE